MNKINQKINNEISKDKTKKIIYVISIFVIDIIMIYLLQKFANINVSDIKYWNNTLIKLMIFIPSIILIYILSNKDKKLINILKIGKIRKSSIIFGFSSMLLIYIGFLITKRYIKYDEIIINLRNIVKSKMHFIYIGIYIALINSFLEEYLFRGILFIYLQEYINKKTAYIISSIFFAIYHISFIQSLANIKIIVFTIFSLCIVGYIFNIFNNIKEEKNKNIYNSYIIHSLSNLSINLITFFML